MTRSQGVRITGVIAFPAFLVWWKLWFIVGVVIFLLALLAFLMWWREKIIEPDNERYGHQSHPGFSGGNILSFK